MSIFLCYNVSIAQNSNDSIRTKQSLSAGDMLLKSYDLKNSSYVFKVVSIVCVTASFSTGLPSLLLLGTGIAISSFVLDVRSNHYIGKAGMKLKQAELGIKPR